MHRRDQEIKRLVLYAKGLGIKVVIYNRASSHGQAMWSLDGSKIEIFAPKGTSKTDIILSCLHELGHHLSFVHDKEREMPKKLDRAWERENADKELSDHERKLIYEDEVAGTEFWDTIIHELDIRIPKWKVEAQKEIDLWMYEVFMKSGLYPTPSQQKKKYKEVRQKWKKKI